MLRRFVVRDASNYVRNIIATSFRIDQNNNLEFFDARDQITTIVNGRCWKFVKEMLDSICACCKERIKLEDAFLYSHDDHYYHDVCFKLPLIKKEEGDAKSGA